VTRDHLFMNVVHTHCLTPCGLALSPVLRKYHIVLSQRLLKSQDATRGVDDRRTASWEYGQYACSLRGAVDRGHPLAHGAIPGPICREPTRARERGDGESHLRFCSVRNGLARSAWRNLLRHILTVCLVTLSAEATVIPMTVSSTCRET
jgi:hypothetical protein